MWLQISDPTCFVPALRGGPWLCGGVEDRQTGRQTGVLAALAHAQGGLWLCVCLLRGSSQVAQPWSAARPKCCSPAHGALVPGWFNWWILSFHWPGWACSVCALKPLLPPVLWSVPNCLASKKLCLLRGQEKGHKMCEMWSRRVGSMRPGPEVSFVCSVHDLPSLFHRLVTTDPWLCFRPGLQSLIVNVLGLLPGFNCPY